MSYQHPFNGVVPELTEDVNLKRVRTDEGGVSAIRVTSTNTADLSPVTDALGDPSDAPWDLSVPDAPLIPIEKKATLDTHTIKTVLGSNEDTSSTASVIGLLKSIASKLQ